MFSANISVACGHSDDNHVCSLPICVPSPSWLHVPSVFPPPYDCVCVPYPYGCMLQHERPMQPGNKARKMTDKWSNEAMHLAEDAHNTDYHNEADSHHTLICFCETCSVEMTVSAGQIIRHHVSG